MVIGEAEYNFLVVDIGANGKNCNYSVLENTEFWRKLMKGELDNPKNIPKDFFNHTKVFLTIVCLCEMRIPHFKQQMEHILQSECFQIVCQKYYTSFYCITQHNTQKRWILLK